MIAMCLYPKHQTTPINGFPGFNENLLVYNQSGYTRVFSIGDKYRWEEFLTISLIDLSKVKCLGQMTRIMVICGQHVNEHSICLNTI